MGTSRPLQHLRAVRERAMCYTYSTHTIIDKRSVQNNTVSVGKPSEARREKSNPQFPHLAVRIYQ